MEDTLFIKMVLDQWHAKIKDANRVLDAVTDEQLQQEVSPGRNTGNYILGHLIAVHDRMLPLLNLGEQIYPEMGEPYLVQPEKAETQKLNTGELRDRWNHLNALLTHHFNRLSSDEWFQKHSAVSDEDFAKEPHRNRLNVIINRTNHLSSHVGQLVFLK